MAKLLTQLIGHHQRSLLTLKSGSSLLRQAIPKKYSSSESSVSDRYNFPTLSVTQPCPHVFHVELNRPKVYNAINDIMFNDIKECFVKLNDDKQCRAVVLSASGKFFCSGIDLMAFQGLLSQSDNEDIARRAINIRTTIQALQDSFNAVENCRKPTISVTHGGCIGAGVDLICATDIRYCSSNDWFQVKEAMLGLAADIGTLQRLPKIVGNDSIVRELVFTARKFDAAEALRLGLVGNVLPDAETAKKSAIDLAKVIASLSPIAVQGSKVNLNFSRDHSVQDGLKYVANWNAAMLQGNDLPAAAAAIVMKSEESPQFPDV